MTPDRFTFICLITRLAVVMGEVLASAIQSFCIDLAAPPEPVARTQVGLVKQPRVVGVLFITFLTYSRVSTNGMVSM